MDVATLVSEEGDSATGAGLAGGRFLGYVWIIRIVSILPRGESYLVKCEPYQSSLSHRLENINKCLHRGAKFFAATDEDPRMNRADLISEGSNAHPMAASYDAAGQKRDDTHSQTCLNHSYDDFGIGRFHVHLRRQPKTVKCVHHVLPARGAALKENQRRLGEIVQFQCWVSEERMTRRCDQAPVHREEVEILQFGR